MDTLRNYGLLLFANVWFDKLFDNFAQLIAVVILALLPQIHKRLIKFWKKHSNYFIHNLNTRKQINDLLMELRIELKGDRVCLFEFSNTDKSISNYPFEYLNMTYEKVSASTAEIRDGWQKKHINPHVDFLQLFSDPNGPQAVVIHANDRAIPESVRVTMRAENIESCLIHKLHKELRYGFIAVHFINRRYPEQWNVGDGQHEHQMRMRVKSHQVRSLMKDLK